MQAFPAAHDDDSDTMEYRLHMMDFSLLAVKALGRAVKEPSMTKLLIGQLVTTSLPYVEVILDSVQRSRVDQHTCPQE